MAVARGRNRGLSGTDLMECTDVCSLFFFFSSRRRHTRCGREWSSDVCSSDLPDILAQVTTGNRVHQGQPLFTLLTRHGRHGVVLGGIATKNAGLVKNLISPHITAATVDAGTLKQYLGAACLQLTNIMIPGSLSTRVPIDLKKLPCTHDR